MSNYANEVALSFVIELMAREGRVTKRIQASLKAAALVCAGVEVQSPSGSTGNGQLKARKPEKHKAFADAYFRWATNILADLRRHVPDEVTVPSWMTADVMKCTDLKCTKKMTLNKKSMETLWKNYERVLRVVRRDYCPLWDKISKGKIPSGKQLKELLEKFRRAIYLLEMKRRDKSCKNNDDDNGGEQEDDDDDDEEEEDVGADDGEGDDSSASNFKDSDAVVVPDDFFGLHMLIFFMKGPLGYARCDQLQLSATSGGSRSSGQSNIGTSSSNSTANAPFETPGSESEYSRQALKKRKQSFDEQSKEGSLGTSSNEGKARGLPSRTRIVDIMQERLEQDKVFNAAMTSMASTQESEKQTLLIERTIARLKQEDSPDVERIQRLERRLDVFLFGGNMHVSEL